MHDSVWQSGDGDLKLDYSGLSVGCIIFTSNGKGWEVIIFANLKGLIFHITAACLWLCMCWLIGVYQMSTWISDIWRMKHRFLIVILPDTFRQYIGDKV